MTEKISTTQDDLSRLVEARWFEWMPGMLKRLRSCSDADLAEFPELATRVGQRGLLRPDAFLPIPSDPATAGCLMEMYLRRFYGNPHVALGALVAEEPGPQEYASFGDFLVAVLLDSE
jgi:hypothetical protein